jgi:hypothetical protein
MPGSASWGSSTSRRSGLLLLLTGILFMVLVGRFLLPDRRVEDVIAREMTSAAQSSLRWRSGWG